MIGRLLGHSKIASTARYAHLDDDSALQAADRVGRLIAQLPDERTALSPLTPDC